MVQFLHATAKEYIQDHRDQILGDKISKVFSGVNGYDFLLLCCVPWDHWVALIKKHMFYYAKMTEMTLSGNDRQPLFARREMYREIFYRIAEKYPGPYSDKCDVRWLIQLHRHQHKGRFMSLFLKYRGAMIRGYVCVILAVLANARLLVGHMLLSYSYDRNFLYATIESLCLLQVATAGPDLIPIELNDRPGMIRTLVSEGYPVDQKSRLCTRKNTNVSETDGSERILWTPLKVVLTGEIESEYDEDAKLAIIDCLLNQSASPNALELEGNEHLPRDLWAPLAYCVQYESVGLVRLLLQYGADPNFEDHLGMQPMHYALI